MWDKLVEGPNDPHPTRTLLRRGGRVRRVETRHLRVVFNQRGQACRDRLKFTDILVELDLEVRALGDGIAVILIDAEPDVVRKSEQVLAERFQGWSGCFGFVRA